MELGWLETVGVFVVAVALYVWANIVSRRPADPFRPRLWSPELLMGAAVVVAIVMLAHMISLVSGVPFRGGAL